MARIRLNHRLRSRLRFLAAEVVRCPAEEAALADAYTAAEKLVRYTVWDRYPPKDMELCKKYEAAFIDDCIKLQLTAGGVEQFQFAAGMGPLVAKKTYNGVIYAADEATTEAVLAWVSAERALKEARKRKLADYEALIVGATTLEDVTEIWPEANTIRTAAMSRALITLNDDVVARIKADVAARKEEQEE